MRSRGWWLICCNAAEMFKRCQCTIEPLGNITHTGRIAAGQKIHPRQFCGCTSIFGMPVQIGYQAGGDNAGLVHNFDLRRQGRPEILFDQREMRAPQYDQIKL